MLPKQILFATSNVNKLQEMRALLDQYNVIGLHDLNIYEDIPENGNTLEENAYIKAKYLYDLVNLPVISEDTGLEVIALDNAPGIFTARYAGEKATPIENMQKLLSALSHHDNRAARFRTVICFIQNGVKQFFEGVVEGHISKNIEGSGGFGYDPIFVPEGHDQSFALLPIEVKMRISHRAKATQKFIHFINQSV